MEVLWTFMVGMITSDKVKKDPRQIFLAETSVSGVSVVFQFVNVTILSSSAT